MLQNIIYDDWLNEHFVCKIPYGVDAISMMDCCHSGSMLDLPYKFDQKNDYFKDTALNGQCKGNSTPGFFGALCNWFKPKIGSCYYLSGCKDEETAKEISHLDNVDT